MSSGPGSSASEQPVLNGKVGGSTPPQGSTYLYAVLRKELTGGALLAQLAHAVTECLRKEDVPLPKDTRVVVLQATKAQLSDVGAQLRAAGISHQPVEETDGELAGSVTGIGLITTNRQQLQPILGTLKPFR